MLHVVLYQPQIPPNTGNVARQCVGMRAHLHIVGPIPFEITDASIKRAGLDYWPHLTLTMHATPHDFRGWLGERKPWLVTKRGKLRYDRPAYRDDDVLIFGAETSGLPQPVLDEWPDRTIYIPVLGPVRSYNLSNSAAIVLAHASLVSGLYDNAAHSPAPEKGSD